MQSDEQMKMASHGNVEPMNAIKRLSKSAQQPMAERSQTESRHGTDGKKSGARTFS